MNAPGEAPFVEFIESAILKANATYNDSSWVAADVNFGRFGSPEEAAAGETFYGLSTDPNEERTHFILHMAQMNFTSVPNLNDNPRQFNVSNISEEYQCTAVKYIVDSCFVDCFKKPNATEGIDYMLIPVFYSNSSAGLNVIMNNDPMGIFDETKIFNL